MEFKGDPKVIDILNRCLKLELSAMNQYLYSAAQCRNLGYTEMAEHYDKEFAEEQKHATRDLTRILFLGGKPEMQGDAATLHADLPAMLKGDLEMEILASTTYNEAVETAGDAGDSVSRKLAESIAEEEEESIDWLQSQLGILAKVGEPIYLMEQVG